MSGTILVLTEEALNSVDVANLASLAEVEPAAFELLVPAETGGNLLVEFLDRLSLLEFAEAFRNLSTDRPGPAEQQREAGLDLAASLRLLHEAGLQARGTVVDGDPVAAVVDAAARTGARQAVVITTPHAVEDTLRTDWANEAQERLHIPVLHLYSGSGFIGDA